MRGETGRDLLRVNSAKTNGERYCTARKRHRVEKSYVFDVWFHTDREVDTYKQHGKKMFTKQCKISLSIDDTIPTSNN